MRHKSSDVASVITMLLAERKLTPSEFSRRSGLSTGHVGDLMFGRRGKRLSFTTITKIAKGFGMTPAKLLKLLE